MTLKSQLESFKKSAKKFGSIWSKTDPINVIFRVIFSTLRRLILGKAMSN